MKKIGLLALFFCSFAVCAAKDAADKKDVAYVPDKSCPFTRGSDEGKYEKAMHGIRTMLTAKASQCPEPFKGHVLSMRDALMKLGAESGVQRFAPPGADGKGYLGIPVNCANYPEVLRAELDGIRQQMHSVTGELTDPVYKEACGGKRPTKDFGCLENAFLSKMRVKRRDCLTEQRAEDWETQRKTYEETVKLFSSSVDSVANGLDSCGAAAPQLLDATMQAVSSLSLIMPALGVYGVGAAIGTQTLRVLLRKAQPGALLKGKLNELERKQTLNRFSCLYMDALSATWDCPARIAQEEKKAREVRMASVPGGSTLFFDALKNVATQARALRDAKAAGRDLIAPLRDLENALDNSRVAMPDSDKLPALARALRDAKASGNDPVVALRALENDNSRVAKFDSRNVPAFTKEKYSVREILDSVAVEQRNMLKPKTVQTRADRAKASKERTRLSSFLEAFDKYKNASDEEFDKQTEALIATLKPSGAETAIPDFDLMDTVSHFLDRYPPAYQFKDLELRQALAQSERPANPGSRDEQADLVEHFNVLVNELKSEKRTLFDPTDADRLYRSPASGSPITLGQNFDTQVLPLFRACALMSGLYFYSPEDRRRLSIPWKGDKSYPEACGMFMCPGGGGLPRYHSQDSPDTFQYQQCWMQQNYDTMLSFVRNNYLFTGTPCGVVGTASHPVRRGTHR